MIKVDVCALRPVVRQARKTTSIITKAATAAIPAIIGKEIFETEIKKNGTKRTPSACSDYCCEPL